MMYNSKLVTSVKCAGKIMREQGDTVFLPFGEEYSLLLKNLNTKRALLHIEIDGEDVTPNGLILGANQTIDLERFIIDGNMDNGPRFKFIEKTERISDYRGDKVDDGIVRVTYQYEAPAMVFAKSTTWISGGNTVYGSTPSNYDGHIYNMNVGSSTTRNMRNQSLSGSDATPVSDAGITVKGSESTQKFQKGYMGQLESEKHVIVLNLKGQINDVPVEAPVTVSRRIKCDVCGKVNSSINKFCTECGDNLTYQY